MRTQQNINDELSRKVAKIQAKILAFVMAIICGLGIFIMTVWLLVKGGPNVGPHLKLLGQFFIGYSVSWTGSFVGFVYGALMGWIVGWLIGLIYNQVVGIRHH
jgi:hypothetical protein